MSDRIPSVVAGSIHFNNYNAPLEPITPLHYYTTMGFSHCSSSSSRDSVAIRAPKDAAALSKFPLVHSPTALCRATGEKLVQCEQIPFAIPQPEGGDDYAKLSL